MSLYKGSNKIAELYYHGVPVAEIYKGNILVFTKAAQEYLVTISQAANGIISAAPMQGPAGTLVTLSNSPNTGYQLTYYTVNGNQIQGNTFTLDSDSTISGQFTAITYTVTIGSHTNGTLTANPMSGTYGTTVSLSGTPNSGYSLDYYTVNGNQIQGNTFTLTGNSTVGAVFKQAGYVVPVIWLTHFDGSAKSITPVYNSLNLTCTSKGNYSDTIQPYLSTITAADCTGNLPSSYIGQQYLTGTSNATTNEYNMTKITATPTVIANAGYKYMYGVWFKNGPNNTATKPTNSTGPYGTFAGFTGMKPSANQVAISGKYGPPRQAMTNSKYHLYNGATKSSTSSSNYCVLCPVSDGSDWHYGVMAFTRVVPSNNNYYWKVEWYVDGVKYLDYNQGGSMSTDANYFPWFNESTSYKYFAWGPTTNTNSSMYMLEPVIRPGIDLTIPTGPIIPQT